MTDNKRYQELASKWLNNTITEPEKAEFAAWYKAHLDEELVIPESFAGSERELRGRLLAKVREGIGKADSNGDKKRRLRWVVAIAASLLLSISIGFYVWFSSSDLNKTAPLAQQDVQPGGNKATLTLADGRLIDLSEAQSGIVVGDGITYLDGSAVIDNEEWKEKNEDPNEGNGTFSSKFSTFNSITTPKGGTYQISLSDGTSVWLNSASTLQYPSRFTGDRRVVVLDGEGYFEVAKDASRPFVVQCSNQEVQVLGTAFNINSYADEGGIRTTLVEGHVRVEPTTDHRQPITLKPGQQALLANDGSGFRITRIDTKEVTAWKAGYFEFNNTDLRTVMRQFARWYDIEVVYECVPGNTTFGGRIPMDMTLGSVLNVLDAVGVEFEIRDGRRLVVNGKRK